jgi:hypothetical protein
MEFPRMIDAGVGHWRRHLSPHEADAIKPLRYQRHGRSTSALRADALNKLGSRGW